MSAAPAWNEDFAQLVEALRAESVEFVIVGAHAMAVHGVPRATGDLDVFVRPTPENSERVYRALLRFGAPVAAHGITPEDFATPDNVYQIGLPPRRIDLLTGITGVDFDTAHRSHVVARSLPFLGLSALLANKRATGRPKDLADVSVLEERQRRKAGKGDAEP